MLGTESKPNEASFIAGTGSAVEGYSPGMKFTKKGRPRKDQNQIIIANDLISESLRRLWINKERPIEETLASQEFWKSFEKDLQAIDNNYYSFTEFMQFIDPDKNADGTPYWKGKYSDLFTDIYNFHFSHFLHDRGNDTASPYTSTKEKILQTFFQQAPNLIKGLLITKFEDDFYPFKKEFYQIADRMVSGLESKGILQNLFNPLLKISTVFTADRQQLLFDSLVSFLDGKLDEPVGSKETISCLVQLMQKRYQEGEIIAPNSPEEKMRIMFTEFRGLAKFQDTVDQYKSSESKDLLQVIENELMVPLAISATYKPAGLFWSMYFQEERGSQKNAAESLDRFIFVYLMKKLTQYGLSSDKRETHDYDFIRYFERKILPKVRSHFQQIATYYSEIQYFPKRSPFGTPKHLYLHQVENIQRLSEQGTGILADEPGLGKTLTLVLTALNSLDRKENQGKGRILIVAGKSPIDNWERELSYHLAGEQLEIVNVNTPPSAHNPTVRLTENATVLRRLSGMKQCLLHPKQLKQLFLVNYDLFRDVQFQELLKKYPIDVLIVDEAHHVKTRDISILEELIQKGDSSKPIAQRTLSLYRFIKNNPSMSVFFATATPIVKTNTEPLILGHLTSPTDLSLRTINMAQHSTEQTYKSLRKVMVRRKKSEVANLPEKETKIIPISLTQLREQEKTAFIETAEALKETTVGNHFAEFYAILSLESQVKLSWLKAKTQELTNRGRKVLIFTPFVYDENRYTGPMGSLWVAKFLRQQGIAKVGILDGSFSPVVRNKVQERFKLPLSDDQSLDVIVGNYDMAGESITLCTPDNRATEVILFVCPNSISKLVQSVDRVHRFGQTEKVTIYVPVVTGDILGRVNGTYDERVIRRLFSELHNFDQVVDGLFFIEPKDVYQEIAREEEKQASFFYRPKEMLDVIGKKKHEPEVGKLPIVGSDKEQEQEQGPGAIEQDEELKEFLREHLASLGVHERLQPEEEKELSLRVQKGLEAEKELQETPNLMEEEKIRLFDQIRKGREAQHIFILSNQGLVASVAKKYYGGDLSFDDLMQEGSIGLLNAARKFDSTLGFKFSTYATWWIRQAITRAIKDKSETIRIPEYLHPLLRKARKISDNIYSETGSRLKGEVLEEVLVDQLQISFETAQNIVRILTTSLSHLPSLDQYIGEDEKSTLADFVTDPKSYFADEVSERTSQRQLREEVGQILEKVLNERERWIITQRHLSDESKRTLEELGQEKGLSRERIRQVEEQSLIKLKSSKELQSVWDKYKGVIYQDMPSYLYKNPEEIFSGERRVHTADNGQSIVVPILSLSKLQAKIAYRYLYLSLPLEQIADELHLTKDNVIEFFNDARIDLWENPEVVDFLSKNGSRSSSIYFPSLDPKEIKNKYHKVFRQLPRQIRQVVETFFGFNGTTGLFSTNEVAKDLALSETQVRRYMIAALRVIG